MLRVDGDHIYIYDVIGPDWAGFVSANAVMDALTAVGKRKAYVHYNSPGGDVFEGVAAFNLMKRHREQYGLESIVDALAASAASYMAMSGEKVTMAEGSMLMVHLAGTLEWGNKFALRKAADKLDKVDASITDIYLNKTGIKVEDMQAMLEAETWMTAKEAIEKGFADSIEGTAVELVSVPKGMFNCVPPSVIEKSPVARKRDYNAILAKIATRRGQSI